MLLFFHALQFSRLSCVGFVVGLVGRVFCRLPGPVFFFVFVFAGVLVYVSVWGVDTVLCCWFGVCGCSLLGGGSISVVFGVWMLSGAGLFGGRLQDVSVRGACVVVVRCLSSRRRDLRVGLALLGI